MSDIPAVYKAISDVTAELAKKGIGKDRKNQQQNYSFRGIDDVYNAIAPILADKGLVIIPRFLSRTCEERQSAKGGALFYVTVEAEFDFVAASDGSKHTARTFGEAMDSADKATNKAMSAAYKYAAFQTFAIPTEGDNDADNKTPDPIPKAANIPAAKEKFAASNTLKELTAAWYTLTAEEKANADIIADYKRRGGELKRSEATNANMG